MSQQVWHCHSKCDKLLGMKKNRSLEIDHKALEERTISIDAVAQILGTSPATVRKNVERGTIIPPQTRSPRLEWDSLTFWGWYYEVARGKGLPVSVIPFRYWPTLGALTPRITYTPTGVEAIYDHPLGRVALIHPVEPNNAGPSASRADPKALVVAVVRGTLGWAGFDVSVYEDGKSDTEVPTSVLARIVGSPLPYWPVGLRHHQSGPDGVARLVRGANSLPVLQALTPIIENAELRDLLKSHLEALSYRAYSYALDDVRYADGTKQNFKEPGHLEIQARPIPFPEADNPEWEDHYLLAVGSDPAVVSAIFAARDSASATDEGARYSSDTWSPAMDSFRGALVPVPAEEVTLGHLFLAGTTEGVKFLRHPEYPEIIAVIEGDGRVVYLPPKVLGPTSRDARLDLSDPTNPFVLIHGDWVPLSQHGWSGVNAGYRGTGPAALWQVISATWRGIEAGNDLMEGSILEHEGFPRNPAITTILSSFDPSRLRD